MSRAKRKLHTSRFKLHELALSNGIWYDPAELRGISLKKLKDEYTTLRDIAQKRLKRMGASAYAGSEPYQYNKDRFKKISEIKEHVKDIKDPKRREEAMASKMRQLLAEVSRFVNTESTTISGQDEILKKRIESLNKSKVRGGSDGHAKRKRRYPVPEDLDEAQAFFKFVDWMREKTSTDYFYDLSSAQRRKINTKKIKEMLANGLYSEAYREIRKIEDIVYQAQAEKRKQARKKKRAQNSDINAQVQRRKKDIERSKRLHDEETLTENDIKGFDRYYRNR